MATRRRFGASLLRALACAAALVASASPGPALAAPVPLVNPGFESRKPGVDGNPEAWVAIQHAGAESYDFALDSGQKKSGTQSLRIKKIGPEPYGTISQVLAGQPYAGRTVRLSAWIRTEAVPDSRGSGAALVLMALRGSSFLAHEFMKRSRIHGTNDWTRYTIELAVPAATTRLELGAMLEGAGTVWVDDFEFEVVDR
ncbi:MAG: hypothetical protein ABI585_00120 [Betaproteobacteria bacterium]